jgi:hypothetical protein
MRELRESARTVRGDPSPGAAAPAAVQSYLGIGELAAATGLSVSTLRRLWRQRRIPGFQPGGPRTRVVFPPDAIERAARADPPPPADVAPGPAGAPPRGPRPKWLDGSR